MDKQEERLIEAMKEKGIPESSWFGICEYVIRRRNVLGGFLSRVFENDLVGAYGAADQHNTMAMYCYASFLYNDVPESCWGSREKMEAWVK